MSIRSLCLSSVASLFALAAAGRAADPEQELELIQKKLRAQLLKGNPTPEELTRLVASEHEKSRTVTALDLEHIRCTSSGGLTLSLGLPYGQVADHRLRYANCVGLHVRDFGAYYEAHLDRVHPVCDLVEHLRQDAPGTYIASGTALGALAALVLSRHPAAILAGAVAGGVLALLTSKEKAGNE